MQVLDLRADETVTGVCAASRFAHNGECYKSCAAGDELDEDEVK